MAATAIAPLGLVPSNVGALAAEEESVLRIGTTGVVDSLNPYKGVTDTSRLFYSLVYDSLFSVNEDLESVGNLATSWWVVPESDPELQESGEPYGSVWEYNITHNAEWHDGEPFTVADVVWNINLNVENYDDMWPYQPYAFFMDYAEAVDPDTVRIHYRNGSTGEPMPVAYGDSIFIPMLPKHLLDTWTPSTISSSWEGVFDETTSPGYPIVGTGPFIATGDIWDDFNLGDNLTVVRNPEYHWADDKGEEVLFDKLVLNFYLDPTGLSMALRSGDLDIAQLLPSAYDEVKDDVLEGTLEDVETFDGLNANQRSTTLTFNMNDDGPNCARLDPAVRKALAMATNKEFIAETYYLGYALPGSTLISPISDWHCELDFGELIEFDFEAAAQLLEDAGYVYLNPEDTVRVASAESYAVTAGLVLEDTPLEFEIVVSRSRPEDLQTANYLGQVWHDEIGVRVLPVVMDDSAMTAYVYGYVYDMAIWPKSADPDPNHMLFSSTRYAWAGWSENKYFNETYDGSYNDSVSAMDPVVRKVHTDRCQHTFYNDVASLTLVYNCQTYAWRTDTFVGWGDWAEEPGRSLDAYWGANPLLFDLVRIDEVANEAPADLGVSFPATAHYVDIAQTFVVSAEDADMDQLYLELDFGDGTAEGVLFAGGESTHYEAVFTHAYEVDGEYELVLTADDQTALPGHVVTHGPVTIAVVVDDVPPVTEIALDGEMGENRWYVSTVDVTFTASDEGGEVVATEWRIDLGTWTEYDGEFTVTQEGFSTLEYRSNDTNGNLEPANSTQLYIDTESPTLSVDIDPKITSSTATVEIAISDGASGIAFLTTSLDGGAVTTSFISADGTYWYRDLSDGGHTLIVTVTDNAGHSTTKTVTFEVETSLFALDGPAGPWIVIGMLVAIVAVIAVAAFLLFKRMKAPGA